MSEALARGVIEIGVDEMKLRDEVAAGQSVVARSFQDSLKRTRIERAERQKLFDLTKSLTYLDTSRTRLQASTATRGMQTIKDSVRAMKELNREQGLSLATQQKLYGPVRGAIRYAAGKGPSPHGIMDAVGRTASVGGATMAAATGLTFAAAAAAGSTTMDTLTGSIKNLGLAAGAKTQGAIMGVSRMLQQMSRSVDKAPVGAVGGFAGSFAGAGLGLLLAGPLGALGGAVGGGLLGYAAERQSVTKSRQEGIAQLMVQGGADKTNELLIRAAKIEREPAPSLARLGRFPTEQEAEKWRGRQRIAADIRAGQKLAEDPVFREEQKAFKKAGLGFQPTITALGDARSQAQLAAFGSPLDIENQMKELNNNIKSLNGNFGNLNQHLGAGEGKAQPINPPGN